jgi:hypothetical protein
MTNVVETQRLIHASLDILAFKRIGLAHPHRPRVTTRVHEAIHEHARAAHGTVRQAAAAECNLRGSHVPSAGDHELHAGYRREKVSDP